MTLILGRAKMFFKQSCGLSRFSRKSSLSFRERVRVRVFSQRIINQFLMTSCRQTGLLVFMPAAFLLLCPSSAKATDRYWNAASGDWSDTDPCPWSLGTEPTASDNAYINNGGTASVTQSAEWCSSLYLGGDDTGGIEMIDGTLSTSFSAFIGYTGTGTFTQTGGTNSISTLVLGNISGSSGSYELSGTGQLSANTEYIGNLGTATKTFTQTGGTNTISSTLYLGYTSGSSGSYELSSTGQLSAVFEYIGRSGTGTFEQTGGINTATYIQINTNGTYTLTGGTLNINGGFVNQGILDLSNSSMVINVSSSIVNLSGTILATTGNATLNIDAHSLLIVPSGHDPAEYFASINNAGCLV